jgi:hypothetical protein
VTLFKKASGVLRYEKEHAAGEVSLWNSDEDGTYYTPEFWPAVEQPQVDMDDFGSSMQYRRYEPVIELIRS